MQQRRHSSRVHLKPDAVEGFADQAAIKQGDANQRQAGNAGHKQRRIAVYRQNRAEQQMQQVDVRAAQRDQRDAQRQGAEIKSGKAGILF